MSSSVFYRFKSQKEPSRITFDGTGISVFELKRDIIAQSRLGDGTDFELLISSDDTKEEYSDDTTIIPRSTTVIARRLPASKAGRGGAARYVSGKMPQNAKVTHRVDNASRGTAQGPGMTVLNGAQSEEEKIAAVLQLGADTWAQQQQQMANTQPLPRNAPLKGKPHGMSDRPLPQGYVCNRCGEKGHWIWDCPTNNDPAFDGRPRIKRTTGIPKSFLKTVEKPATDRGDGASDDQKPLSGVMVNADGEWVVAEPDQAAWDKYHAQAKSSVAAQSMAIQENRDLQTLGLECNIDKRLFVDPTKTPCCGQTYCFDCIQNALLDNDLRCPNCGTENVPIDDLVPDKETADRIRTYERQKAAKPSQTGISQQPSLEGSEHTEKTEIRDETHAHDDMRATTDTAPETAARSSKKRPAESEPVDEQRSKSPNVNLRKGDSKSARREPPSVEDRQQTNTSVPANFDSVATAPSNSFPDLDMPFNLNLSNPMMMSTPPFLPSTGWGSNIWMGANPYVFQQAQSAGHSAPADGSSRQPESYMQVNDRFTNQQRPSGEEDSAYFRKPVNPNRQSHRRAWNQNRPADYHEV